MLCRKFYAEAVYRPVPPLLHDDGFCKRRLSYLSGHASGPVGKRRLILPDSVNKGNCMTSLANVSSKKKSSPLIKRDTVQIMGDAFHPEQLRALVDCLEGDGHRCLVFNGKAEIHAALSGARTKLLLLGAAEDEAAHLIEAIRQRPSHTPHIPVIVYFTKTQRGSKDEILHPVFDDFLLEPLNLNDVRLRVRRLEQQLVDRQNEVQQVKLNLASHFGMRQFIGGAPAFLKTIEKIPRVATCDAPVLIIGGTGTGKEMCARAIHYLSPRADKPFLPINCGSIPAELFENEMFGHEPGAYTDARRSQRGMIAEAEGGTLFLDEVDSLPLSAQVKLMRFLQDQQYRPLGASHYRQANIRLVAASNQNLQDKVREGTFREDLYYRLKVVSLDLPLLCDRHEDILPLALHFLETSALEYNRPVTRFSNSAVQKLLSYAWPGNVRELENVVRQAVVMADGPVLRAEDIRLSSDVPVPVAFAKESLKAAKARMIEAFERNYLKDVIASCGGNISRAAREAQKDRRTFFALMQKYGLTSGAQGQSEELNFEEVVGAPFNIGASAFI